MNLKKMNKNDKKILLIYIIVIGFILIYFIGSYTGLWAVRLLDDDAGEVFEPSTDYAIGTPVLDPISPEVDYDGIINLQWNLESPYTITKFYIFQSINSSSFVCFAILGNVHSYTATCPTEAIYRFRVMGSAIIDGEIHMSQFSNIQSVQVSFQESTIPILKAIESPNIDGTIELDWNEVTNPFGGSVSGYRIYRLFTTSGGWLLLDEVSRVTEYVDTIDVNGSYQYYIKSITYINILNEVIESEASNIQTVAVSLSGGDPTDPDFGFPTNPSIEINDGNETTDSFIVFLTLSCGDADKMQFKLAYDTDWTAWETYSTSKVVTLPEDSIDYPEYWVGVIFKNSYGETNIVCTGIEYNAPEPPTDPYIIINGGDRTTNSFEVTFTLECDNANEMRFQIADGFYLDWVSYDTTYSLTLNESNPDYPNYQIGVTFKNNYGESEEAFDGIIYSTETGNGDGVGEYTITYILVGVLVGLLAIVGIFMFLRKRRGISVSKKVK